MPYDFGDIILVNYPYSDQAGAKKGPAVVVSQAAYNIALPDVILMPVSSQIRIPLRHGELLIREWQLAGLLRASVIKPVFATVEQILIQKSLGVLQLSDQSVLRNIIATVLG
jgi:mRNA interferase MazF